MLLSGSSARKTTPKAIAATARLIAVSLEERRNHLGDAAVLRCYTERHARVVDLRIYRWRCHATRRRSLRRHNPSADRAVAPDRARHARPLLVDGHYSDGPRWFTARG